MHSMGFNLRWLDTVFLKNRNLRFRSVFLENYYLFEDKEYFCYVKQHLKSSNSFTKVAQLRCYGNNDVSKWRIFWL